MLLCINGTGILNSWVRRNIVPEGCSYDEMNRIAESVPVGSEGLSIIPFGNGAERVMQNRETVAPSTASTSTSTAANISCGPRRRASSSPSATAST